MTYEVVPYKTWTDDTPPPEEGPIISLDELRAYDACLLSEMEDELVRRFPFLSEDRHPKGDGEPSIGMWGCTMRGWVHIMGRVISDSDLVWYIYMHWGYRTNAIHTQTALEDHVYFLLLVDLAKKYELGDLSPRDFRKKDGFASEYELGEAVATLLDAAAGKDPHPPEGCDTWVAQQRKKMILLEWWEQNHGRISGPNRVAAPVRPRTIKADNTQA
jgi:hypothetical protein